MKSIFIKILLLILFIGSCGSGESKIDNKEEVDNSEIEIEEKVDDADETENNYQDYNSNYDYGNESDNSFAETENKPPKIQSISISSLSNDMRDGFKASIESSDPDGDTVYYIYQWKINGVKIPGETEETLQWQEEFKKGDMVTLEVIPYDDNTRGIWKSEGSFEIPNSAPRITSQPSGVASNGNFTYKVKAGDPDGDELTFSLKDAPSGMTISESTGEINWRFSADNAGDYKVGIVVSDGNGSEAYQELDLNIEPATESQVRAEK